MTINEFQTKYHDYMTTDAMEALSDAMKLKVVDENGKQIKVVPMKFGEQYCLMLETAAALVKDLGIGQEKNHEIK